MNQHPSYIKLAYARCEIRLLTILDDDDDYLVRCMTRKTSLDDCQKFNALSYSLGRPGSYGANHGGLSRYERDVES
jgi:hypothetical protein